MGDQDKTREDQAQERIAQLEATIRELEAFTYTVSHDLRAPLRHIIGFASLVAENYGDQLHEEGRQYLDVVMDSARKMSTLIDDLLQFAIIGHQEMTKTDLDMNLVVEEAQKSLSHDVSGRRIDWEISPLPAVHGDHGLLRVVWVNLLGNAIKFTRGRDVASIRIGAAEEPDQHLFYIRDNGAGFDMKYAHKLFGVFQRLHSVKEFEGTGIGLANVRRIVSKHGGRTWAESNPGGGATFFFTLPKQVKELPACLSPAGGNLAALI
jgi:chemotaxis family two-component system sensor kinase Cph1